MEFVGTGGKEMSIASWDGREQVDQGLVVQFGNRVPARMIDTKEMEERRGELL